MASKMRMAPSGPKKSLKHMVRMRGKILNNQNQLTLLPGFASIDMGLYRRPGRAMKKKRSLSEEIFQALLQKLPAVEIDEEQFFVIEGDLLMTEEELRAVSVKRLEYFAASAQAARRYRALEQAAQQMEDFIQDQNEDTTDQGSSK